MQSMYIKLTESCNLKCPFCYVVQNNNKMTLKTALESIDKYNPEEIIFHGGEPTLEKKLILNILKNRPNYKYSITTNLMTNIDKELEYILKKCSVATSYSYDRFINKNQFDKFKSNFNKVIKINDITLLITLTPKQLIRPTKELCNIIKELNPTNVTLERVRLDYITDINEYKNLYKLTDEYLYEIFSRGLIPIEKNNLYKMIVKSIKTNTPVFSNCNVITVNPDGSVINCPNGPLEKKRLKECITCNIYQYCKNDCQSFSSLACSFPIKTVSFVKEALYNGSNER